VPGDVSYGVDVKSMMKWVQNGGRLVVFGGKGEIYDNLGLIDAGYSDINSVGIGSLRVQLNETLSVKSFSYPANRTNVLSYYQLNGKNVFPFSIEEEFGKGSIVYFYVDPIYNMDNALQGSLVFNSNFLTVVVEELGNLGIGHFSIINSEIIPTTTELKEQPWQSDYRQEYALPLIDILLSPFNIILVSVVVFVFLKFRKYFPEK
jgi:hypothetical protein